MTTHIHIHIGSSKTRDAIPSQLVAYFNETKGRNPIKMLETGMKQFGLSYSQIVSYWKEWKGK